MNVKWLWVSLRDFSFKLINCFFSELSKVFWLFSGCLCVYWASLSPVSTHRFPPYLLSIHWLCWPLWVVSVACWASPASLLAPSVSAAMLYQALPLNHKAAVICGERERLGGITPSPLYSTPIWKGIKEETLGAQWAVLQIFLGASYFPVEYRYQSTGWVQRQTGEKPLLSQGSPSFVNFFLGLLLMFSYFCGVEFLLGGSAGSLLPDILESYSLWPLLHLKRMKCFSHVHCGTVFLNIRDLDQLLPCLLEPYYKCKFSFSTQDMQKVSFNKPSRWFWNRLQFQNNCMHAYLIFPNVLFLPCKMRIARIKLN